MTRSFMPVRLFICALSAFCLSACFSREEKKNPVATQQMVDSRSSLSQKNLQPTFTDLNSATNNSGNNSAKVAERSPKDHELLRLARYLEQADAVHREAWWVVAADRKSPGKTIFGKIQRALWQELNLKVATKALYRCDKYQVTRSVSAAKGLPQSGQIFESCQKAPVLLADFQINQSTEGEVTFYSQGLGELLGLNTSIFSHRITCQLQGDTEGKLRRISCKNFVQDRSAQQDLRFSTYEYERDGNVLLTLKGQVYESLYPIRKFEAQVPAAGKIHVVETQTQAPEPEVPILIPAPPPPKAPPAVAAPGRMPPVNAAKKAPLALPADADSIRRRQLETGQSLEELQPGLEEAGPTDSAAEAEGSETLSPGQTAPAQPGAIFGEAEPYHPDRSLEGLPPGESPVEPPNPPPGVRDGSEDRSRGR